MPVAAHAAARRLAAARFAFAPTAQESPNTSEWSQPAQSVDPRGGELAGPRLGQHNEFRSIRPRGQKPAGSIQIVYLLQPYLIANPIADGERHLVQATDQQQRKFRHTMTCKGRVPCHANGESTTLRNL